MKIEELIEAFESGDLGQVEFFELALDAGMDIRTIGEILNEDANSQFGVGA